MEKLSSLPHLNRPAIEPNQPMDSLHNLLAEPDVFQKLSKMSALDLIPYLVCDKTHDAAAFDADHSQASD